MAIGPFEKSTISEGFSPENGKETRASEMELERMSRPKNEALPGMKMSDHEGGSDPGMGERTHPHAMPGHTVHDQHIKSKPHGKTHLNAAMKELHRDHNK